MNALFVLQQIATLIALYLFQTISFPLKLNIALILIIAEQACLVCRKVKNVVKASS